MKTPSFSNRPAAGGSGSLACVCVVTIGLVALAACATRQNQQTEAGRDAQKGPRFLAVPADLLPPAAPVPVAKVVSQNEMPPQPAPESPTAAVAPPASADAAPAPATAAMAPSTAPPARTESHPTNGPRDTGKRLYGFKADQLELRLALAQFARANNLNIIPDNDVVGTITVDLHDLPLEQVMRGLLDAADCSWQEEGGLIRVRNTETRTFTVDYLQLARTGQSRRSGDGTGGTPSGATAKHVSGLADSGTNPMADNPSDLRKELRAELTSMLTEPGRQSLVINTTAGVVEVTDRPSVLRRVDRYLKGLDRSIHRQVEIDVKLYSVTLNDQSQLGLDWSRVAEAYDSRLRDGAAAVPTATAGPPFQNSPGSGLNRNVGDLTQGGNLSTLVLKHFNADATMDALKAQGKVEVVSKPRVRTFNHQTAVIKVGEAKPFFNTGRVGQQSGTIEPMTTVNSSTIGTVLSLTPLISEDGWISLDICPVLTSLTTSGSAPSVNGSSSGDASSGTAASNLETLQASSLVRVRDGMTVVLGGLIQTTVAKNKTKAPLLSEIPVVGSLFTGTRGFQQREELVIFVTPHIVGEDEQPVSARVEERHAGALTLK